MHRRVAFLLFAAGWGANHFASLLVVYRKELGLSPQALATLFGAYSIGLIPGLILAGRISDTRGRRALVLPASLLCIAASGVLAFGSHGFVLLFIGRLLYGLGMGCVMSPGSVWVQELSPPELGPRRATLALSAGFGLGPLVSGFVAEGAPYPMVLPYIAHALMMGAAVILAEKVPETAAIAKPEAKAGAPRRSLGRSEYSLLIGLLPSGPWSFACASVTCATVPGLMRPYVSHPIIFSGFLVAATLMTGVLVQPLTTRIGRPADLVGIASGIVGFGIAAYGVSRHSPTLVFVAAPFLGAGYGLVITNGLREISQRVAGRERGTVVGMYYVITYIGFWLPLVHASFARTYGDVPTLLTTAAIAAACLVIRAIVEATTPLPLPLPIAPAP